MLRRKSICLSVGVAMACGAAFTKAAGIGATGTLTSQQLTSNSWEYFITLNNTGGTNVGTFWFSWFPGYDLLPHAPTSVISPSGWTGTVEQEGINGTTASVEWSNLTTPLASTKSLSGFDFISSDPPSAINGTSLLGFATEYSYVYIAAAETDPGAVLTVQTVVPEPTSLALLATPAAWMLRRKRSVSRTR